MFRLNYLMRAGRACDNPPTDRLQQQALPLDGKITMTAYTSIVSEAHILRQAVLNTSSSIELLREAVSNSIDAGAQSIDIRLESIGGDIWNITMQDDGNGMEEAHLRAYFNAGETVKDFSTKSGNTISIGEKGLGSKTAFVARRIHIESRRFDNQTHVLVGEMVDPLSELSSGRMPTYTAQLDPPGFTPSLMAKGTRILLEGVHITTFNGKRSSDPDEIARRVMHYLRTMCATGTVKNRHASKTHILDEVVNVGVIPRVTVEVINTGGNSTLGPVSGSYPIPDANVAPTTGGTNPFGIAQNSSEYSDILDFARSRTISLGGTVRTIYYDGTAVIAGEAVRGRMLEGELKQGWTQKSQMGLHLCKDFIPLKNDNSLSRELLGGEYYYEFKVFLNCQNFQLNADRNVVTNEESDEISWIWQDFLQNVWPSIEAKALPYRRMKDDEDAATEAVKKTQGSQRLKGQYATLPTVAVTKSGASLNFVKAPQKEADVSHLLAMMVQSGDWSAELNPIVKFGQYINDSTDALVEDITGTALLVEIEYSLQNLFRHKHPMNSYDLVVVWDLGGMTNGSAQTAPWGTNGSSVPVTLISGPGSGEWHLKWGTSTRKVIVLRDIL